jgi:hypothetical protein
MRNEVSFNCQAVAGGHSRFTVSVHFECSDVFILAHFNVGCLCEASRMIGSEMSVRLDGEDFWLWLDDRKTRQLRFDDGYQGEDQCGKWLPNANRRSQDDFLEGLLPYWQLPELCNPDVCFKPTWICVVRYEYGKSGKFKRTHLLPWVDIYKPGMDQRYSGLYQRTA